MTVAREPTIGIPDDLGPPVIRKSVLTTDVYNIISGLIDTPIYRDHKDVFVGTYYLLKNQGNK